MGADMDPSGVIVAVCRSLEIDEADLVGSTRHPEISWAGSLVRYTVNLKLSVSGSQVARRLNVDRSAVRRAVQRAANDTDLTAAARVILQPLEPGTTQRCNNVFSLFLTRC